MAPNFHWSFCPDTRQSRAMLDNSDTSGAEGVLSTAISRSDLKSSIWDFNSLIDKADMYMRISSFRRHPALKRKKYCSKRNHEHDGRMQINVRLQADCSRMSKAVPLGIFIYRNDQSDHNHKDIL